MKHLLIATIGIAVVASWAYAGSQFVKISKPFANVYEFLDPKSRILTQAKKGDHFELVYAGTSWYQVKVKEKVGWLERRAGDVVGSPTAIPVGSVIVFVIVLVGTLAGVFFFVQRQRAAESEA